jgi:tetratricopeptide (TPR) repeat protein
MVYAEYDPLICGLIQAIEPDTRQTIQSTAITAYTTALSYTSDSVETYYQLALQHAWQRNLEKSITALSHALHLNKLHVPSIHLLTLVLTALDDYEKALQTCHTIKFEHIKNLNIEDAAALMEMQLTYLRLVEVVSGKDLALEVQKGVFKLYSRLFGHRSNLSHTKKETDLNQPVTIPEPISWQSTSNLPKSRHMKSKPSLGAQSMQSKLSLQVPNRQSRRARSLLKKKSRSRSVDGRSLHTPSSGDFSEKAFSSFFPFRALLTKRFF